MNIIEKINQPFIYQINRIVKCIIYKNKIKSNTKYFKGIKNLELINFQKQYMN